MLRLDRISKIYPTGEPLRDATWEVKPGERVGLVGANGSGKTTQFRIIAGEVEPTAGEVFRPPAWRVAYLTQEFELSPANTVKEELLTAFTEAHRIQRQLHEVQHALGEASTDEMERLLKKMDRLQREFEAVDGYALERKVEKILPDIGFSGQDGDRLVEELSGGWQMRIGFGKVMLREPDILLLDEPTNHIDLETIEWLENFLLRQSIPMVVVSHDRQFLDRICTKIVEMERGVAKSYQGNYSSYMALKAELRAAQQATFERQQDELSRQQAFIDRFRASATRSTQAKSREKQLEKLDLVEAPEAELRTLEFRFPATRQSGKVVADIKTLSHAYGENILFLDANLTILRGDRIALLGANGSGKSTLLRLLTGQEMPEHGTVVLGEHNVRVAYFEQNQAEALDMTKTVLATIADAVHSWKDSEIRGLLGRFLFTGDSVFKRVAELSGGEKARLALAKLLTGEANFLVLDEPTNHLDIPAKETLEAALRSFAGTVVVVSHDRYFISQVANKIVEIRDGQLIMYPGGYEYYRDKLAQEKERAERLQAEQAREAALAEKRDKQRAKERAKQQKLNERKQARKLDAGG